MSELKPIVESYNTEEEHLYNKTYIFIKGYAHGRSFKYTLKALPLARKAHNGQYRKGLVEVDGQMVNLPYILHPLKVCSTLISLSLPLPDEELDLLYACAICHDILEDAEEMFPQEGRELITEYGFPEEFYLVLKLLSKHSGSTPYEINEYFNHIKKNKIALLIKMADRSHNVEDLYNMKNIDKYIKETKDYFLSKNSIAAYGKANYPEISNGITILKSKILSLTEATEVMMHREQAALKEKDEEIALLKEKVQQLEMQTKFP